VDAASVVRAVSLWTGIPEAKVAGHDADITAALGEDLGVPGREIGEHIKARHAAKLPAAVVLYASKRTRDRVALAVARCVYGDERAVVHVAMSDYFDPHTTSNLKGSPTGYLGSLDGGFMTEAVRRKPGVVVLARDPELACRQAVSIFEEVVEFGFTRDGQGHLIDFSNATFIFATSDANWDLSVRGVLPISEPEAADVH
jgi:hypothetical protein